MMIDSILPFIAIALFLLALLFRKREAGALGWIFIAGYCCFATYDCFEEKDYLYAAFNLLFLAFSLLLAFLLLKTREKEDLLFTITKIAFITSACYFPFAEITFLSELLINITAEITTMVLNLFNVGVYMDPPPCIYTTTGSFHDVNKPVQIILACTAIQSMVLFTGLIFGVNAPLSRKLKAFAVSIPTIYVLNIVRNVFVAAAYFGQWFGSPIESFYIAHEVLARIGSIIALVAIAYAVFMILPEILDLIEELYQFILKTVKRDTRS